MVGLFRYDGREITAIYQEPYLPGDGFFVADMFVFADQLYFTGRTSPHGPGLFRVDMVPEPSSILILGIGFCACVAERKPIKKFRIVACILAQGPYSAPTETSHPPNGRKGNGHEETHPGDQAASRLGFAGLLLFATCSLSLAQGEFPWHNAANPEDVNADQTVWADDVMPVLNCLHGFSDYCIVDPEDGGVMYSNQLSPPPYLDVHQLGNQAIPLNALLVINEINLTVPRTPPANPITTAQARFKARLAATDASGNALER